MQQKLLGAYRFRVLNLTQQAAAKSYPQDIKKVTEIAKELGKIDVALKEFLPDKHQYNGLYHYIQEKANKKLGIDVTGQFGSSDLKNMIVEGIGMLGTKKSDQKIMEMIKQKKEEMFQKIESSSQVKGKIMLANMFGMNEFKVQFNQLISDEVILSKIKNYREACVNVGFDINKRLEAIEKIKQKQETSSKDKKALNEYAVLLRNIAFIPHEKITKNQDLFPDMEKLLNQEKVLKEQVKEVLKKNGIVDKPSKKKTSTSKESSQFSFSGMEESAKNFFKSRVKKESTQTSLTKPTPEKVEISAPTISNNTPQNQISPFKSVELRKDDKRSAFKMGEKKKNPITKPEIQIGLKSGPQTSSFEQDKQLQSQFSQIKEVTNLLERPVDMPPLPQTSFNPLFIASHRPGVVEKFCKEWKSYLSDRVLNDGNLQQNDKRLCILTILTAINLLSKSGIRDMEQFLKALEIKSYK